MKTKVFYEKYELVSAPGHNMLKPVPGTSEIIAIDSSEDVEKYRGELQASGYIVVNKAYSPECDLSVRCCSSDISV